MRCEMHPPTLTPTPNPRAQGGGEQTECAAPLVSSSLQQSISLRVCPGCASLRNELRAALRPGHANLCGRPVLRSARAAAISSFHLHRNSTRHDFPLHSLRRAGDAVAAGARGQGESSV